VRDSVITLNNAIVNYHARAVFPWMENFELAGFTLDTTSKSKVNISKTNDPAHLLPGYGDSFSGFVQLTNDSDIFEAKSREMYSFPGDGTSIFLEMNYKINHQMAVGVFYTTAGMRVQRPLVVLNKTENWNKVYINLTVPKYDTPSATDFQIFFGAQKETGSSDAVFLIDNLKLVHFNSNQMNRKLQVARYVFADLFSAVLAWAIFFTYRKYAADPNVFNYPEVIYNDKNLLYGLIFIPIFWLCLYIMMGTYRRIYRKARLKELGQTLLITIIGVIILFFTLIIDDMITEYHHYYDSILVFSFCHFIPTYTFRLILTSITTYKIHNKIIGFNTIIVGSNGNAIGIFNEIENQEKSSGNHFVGFVNAAPYKDYKLEQFLPHLGQINQLKRIIMEHNVEEVIIATERSEVKTIEQIITEVESTNVIIKVIPDMQDYLLRYYSFHFYIPYTLCLRSLLILCLHGSSR
jgi:hypothetical protein